MTTSDNGSSDNKVLNKNWPIKLGRQLSNALYFLASEATIATPLVKRLIMEGVTYTLAESIRIMNKANCVALYKLTDAKLKQLNQLFSNNFFD